MNVTDRRLKHARRMRKAPTFAEALLWRVLRGRRFGTLKFRRQAPIGNYIVDFACLKRRLIVELDGGIHAAPFYDREREAARDAWLKSEGYKVLRFQNHQVENTPHEVFARIRAEVGGG